jgi:hypothetical protein
MGTSTDGVVIFKDIPEGNNDTLYEDNINTAITVADILEAMREAFYYPLDYYTVEYEVDDTAYLADFEISAQAIYHNKDTSDIYSGDAVRGVTKIVMTVAPVNNYDPDSAYNYQWCVNDICDTIRLYGDGDNTLSIPKDVESQQLTGDDASLQYRVKVVCRFVNTPTSGETPEIPVNDNTKVISVVARYGDAELTSKDYWLIPCDSSIQSVEFTVTTEAEDAKVFYDGEEGSTFTVSTDRADVYAVPYTVRSSSGREEQYLLYVERRFAFREIVEQMFNNILYIKNNYEYNGGYSFVGYKWYKEGEQIDTGQYYVAGKRDDVIDYNSRYTAEMLTTEGKVMHVCWGTFAKAAAPVSVLSAYPNPVLKGGSVKIICPPNYFDKQPSVNVQVVNSTGSIVGRQTISAGNTEISLPAVSGTYLILVNTDMVKVVVK